MSENEIIEYIEKMANEKDFKKAIFEFEIGSYKKNLIKSNHTGTQILKAVLAYMEKYTEHECVFKKEDEDILYKLIKDNYKKDKYYAHKISELQEQIVENETIKFTENIEDNFKERDIRKIFLDRLTLCNRRGEGSLDYYCKKFDVKISNMIEKEGFIKFLRNKENEYNYTENRLKTKTEALNQFYGHAELKEKIIKIFENNSNEKKEKIKKIITKELKLCDSTLKNLLKEYNLIGKYTRVQNAIKIPEKQTPKFTIKNNKMEITIENASFVDDLEINDYFVNEENEKSFKEGMKELVLHTKIERDYRVIKLAKNIFFKKNKRLYCQICGFDFYKYYGEIGENYIEGHHKVPLGEIKEESKTSPSDILLVCANCHRMLHRRIPAYSAKELKENMPKFKKSIDKE
ncbi:HNH endonuclease [Clostridium felsineum]|uniref:Uncharacterized protein n=1 Tax=Clostridium felsineum TaxID=36839 RepID=A0A1S8L4D5_9CLOT|nr:HNH endonuclease [Clostridium felsineum]URZ06804.1 hypothetical protein CLROS_021370 [Clostridium felsineum]URZ11836.1 hypothetical protein CROST_025530 [Clostridium felsineum]